MLTRTPYHFEDRFFKMNLWIGVAILLLGVSYSEGMRVPLHLSLYISFVQYNFYTYCKSLPAITFLIFRVIPTLLNVIKIKIAGTGSI